jgi:hypothetical protein
MAFHILRIVVRIAAFAGLAVSSISAVTPIRALAQAAPDPNAAAIADLQTYELPDQTASARLPSDWNVVATGVGFIQARGPNGELALFGVMIPAVDASPTGLSASGITQPYSSDPEQKFLEAINWIRAHNGKPAVEGQFLSSTPISAPAAFGNCSNIIAILNGAFAVETDFCALPADASGNYRDFFKAVGLPLREAKQERSLMEAILASFRLNMQAIQAHHAAAPANPAPAGSVSATVSAENSLIAGQLMMQEANAINAETFAGMQGMDNSVSNFDHGILRGQTPIYAQGMPEPVFWVGD